MTIEEFLKNRRKPVAVIRDDTGKKVLVDPLFLQYLAADRVQIIVPDQEGTGRVVPLNEQDN